MNTLNQASREWSVRPNDQRFLTLEDLHRSVLARKRESWTAAPACTELRVLPTEDGGIGVEVLDPTHGDRRMLSPTNWSFNQLAQFAEAPASYLRKLPPDLASINLQYGLEHGAKQNPLVLAQSNGNNTLRAMTSTSYGRIWDHQVVESVQKVNSDGRWVIPSASYSTTNPLRATTLYASDRDVFIFLVDPKNPIEVGKEQLFRGFFAWNSEVGAAVFGLTTFLYRYVCDNRIVWGATDVKELRIRHTGGAPERFAYEGAKYLKRYAEEASAPIIEQIQSAQNKEVKTLLKKDQKMEDWLADRGFTKAQAKASIETAQAEEGQARSVWDIIQGVTAYARSIPNTDTRVELETRAGKLMQLAV